MVINQEWLVAVLTVFLHQHFISIYYCFISLYLSVFQCANQSWVIFNM